MKLSNLTIIFTSLFLIFSLSACSDESSGAVAKSVPTSKAETVAWKDDSLFVTFSSGLNEGKQKYITGERSGASIKLSFAKNNGAEGVMFFEARDLISKDGKHQISSLKRYTKGDLKLGDNEASTWRGDAISKGDECDEVSIAVDQGPSTRIKTYGNSVHCNDLKVLSITDWRDAGTIKKERQVTGVFSDTVKFKDEMTDIKVEFVVTQNESKY